MTLANKILSKLGEAAKSKDISIDHKGKKLEIKYRPNGFQMDVYWGGKEVGRFDTDNDPKQDVSRAKGFVDDEITIKGTNNSDRVTSLKVGDTLDLEEAKIKIISISVADVHMSDPKTWIVYNYEVRASGKKGQEQNTLENFKKNILK